jgi:hypothetical protein
MSRVCTGINVANCTAAVAQQAIPIVTEAIVTAQKVTDLLNIATTISGYCAPFAVFVPLEVLCYPFLIALNLGGITSDINTITADVSDIIARAPVLQQNIQTCSAVVENATTAVNNLIGNIQQCVNTYVSSTA